MRRKITTQELTTMSLLAALLCVSSYIYIPMPVSAVPITAQVLVVFLIGLLLKPKKAVMTVGVWLLLGIVGLPVFSGGQGGFGILAGPTGGFAVGYLAMVFLIAFLGDRCKKKGQLFLVLVLIGLPVLYLIGVFWMKTVTGLNWEMAFLTGAVCFLPWDIIKAAAALYIAKPLRKMIYCQKENP